MVLEVDRVIHARWIIPMHPTKDTVLEHHALVLQAGTIMAITPSEQVASQYRSRAPELRLDHHIVCPGLINAHSHAAMTLLRSYADDLSLQAWLEKIWAVEAAMMSHEFVADGTRLAIAEMIRCGVTCFNDMYFFPEAAAEVAAEIGMRATIGIPVLEFPNKWVGSTDVVGTALRKGEQLLAAHKDHPLIRIAVAPHAPYTVSNDENWRTLREYSERLDVRIHTHVHETAKEVADSLVQFGKRPIERLAQLSIFGPRTIAVHMTQLTDDEIVLMAESKSHVVHCPESNMKLGSGQCRIRALVHAGVNVALGTDGAASNDDHDLFGEMRTAVLLDRLGGGGAALDAHEILAMATINGARALGIEDTTGSLAVGKAADIVAVRVLNEPVYDPIATLVYVGTNRVSHVWVAGKELLRDGELTFASESALRESGRAWGERIRATMRPPANE